MGVRKETTCIYYIHTTIHKYTLHAIYINIYIVYIYSTYRDLHEFIHVPYIGVLRPDIRRVVHRAIVAPACNIHTIETIKRILAIFYILCFYAYRKNSVEWVLLTIFTTYTGKI